MQESKSNADNQTSMSTSLTCSSDSFGPPPSNLEMKDFPTLTLSHNLPSFAANSHPHLS